VIDYAAVSTDQSIADVIRCHTGLACSPSISFGDQKRINESAASMIRIVDPRQVRDRLFLKINCDRKSKGTLTI